MLWDNYTLISFIKERSGSIDNFLLPQRPNPPENNPLVKDRVSIEAIKLREKLDEIQGKDKDNELTGSIVSAITIGSRVTPIPKDHSYLGVEIGEYKKYLNELDEWNETRDFLNNQELYEPYSKIDDIPILSILYSLEKNDIILVMSSNDNYVRELNIDTMENVLGNRYRNQISYYYKAMPNEINDYLINVDFEELKKRLINAGYSSLVSEVNKQLSNYL